MVKVDRENFHHFIFIAGIGFLLFGLVYSVFFISASQFLLSANWLLQGDFKRRFKLFFNNRLAIVLSSLFLLHIIGLLWTTDFGYAFKDLRTKAPLLILPLIFSTTKPLEYKEIKYLLNFFILLVLVSSIISFLTLTGITGVLITDVRKISLFVSHIRFGLMICLSIYIIVYFWLKDSAVLSKKKNVFRLLLIIWFVLFLFVVESVTGLVILLLTGFFWGIYFAFKAKKSLIRIIMLSGLSIFSVLVGAFIYSTISDFYIEKQVNNSHKYFTKKGNAYSNIYNNKETENGYLTYYHICRKELEGAWNKRSSINFDSKDKKGQPIIFTIIRYITSKGLKKDEEGVLKLTMEDIKAIENGSTNAKYTSVFNPASRLYSIIWECDNYIRTGNPNGYSAMMRIEFWKASLGIISNNKLIGVGTGDMNIAFKEYYQKTNSPLDEKWRLRSHNQFLSITVGFGIFGLCWFIFILFYPLFQINKIDFLYISFFLIFIISLLNEDTLESQAGLTFYVFFNTFFLFCRKDKIEETV